jgi:hypothetical protein
MDGTIDLNTNDIEAALCMTNTTADTEIDVNTVGTITTLDECDSGGYARLDLADEAVTADDTNDRAEFDATDLSFTSLGGDATRAIQGVLLYKKVTNDTDNIPIAFIDFASDVPTTATQIDIPWSSEGIIQLA